MTSDKLTDNSLNALEQILESLADEDKQRLAALLTKDIKFNPQAAPQPETISTELIKEEFNEIPKRRKQRRGGKAATNKPIKREKNKKKQYRGMGEGTGRRIARSEPLDIGHQPDNRFDKFADKDGSKRDVSIDKLLWGDNKPVPRLGRKPEFVTATCSRCEYEFDDVPVELCYSDDEGTVFCCDECGTKR